ncbi:unnamed protein product [Calypogeia fissa]
MDGPELPEEDHEDEIAPAVDGTTSTSTPTPIPTQGFESRPPEEMLEARPRPAPILVLLLIVIWLWVPFIASVVFLVVILGIFAIAENPSELISLQGGSFSGVSTNSSVGELLGLRKSLHSLFGISVWDASSVVVKLWNQLLDSSPALQGITRDGVAVAATQVDWIETFDAHIFRADVPGLRKEDVKVELEGDSILQISGQRSRDGDGEGIDLQEETWHRVERSQGRFLRRFQLPVNSLVDEVQAKVENGVLTVTVPKIKKQPVPIRAVEIH